MNKLFKTAVVLSASIAILTQAIPVYACAFSSETYFTFPNHPDLPLNPYAAGKLGILRREYARSYLLVAHRYLSGEPLDTEEQKQIVSLWNTRLTAGDFGEATDTGSWTKAREKVTGAPKIAEIFPNRSVSKEENYQTYCNCQGSAFITAAKTLQELITKFGAGAPAVKQWLEAQDQVFSNCGNQPYSDSLPPASIPAPLPATADAELQKQRNYQIAAANFYAQNFQAAAKEFEAIALDPHSPWKNIASYLAVRALIRQATLAKTLDNKLLEQAQEKIKKLIADPSFSNLAGDLEKLRSFVAVRLDPGQHLQELAKSKKITEASACELTKTIDWIALDDEGRSEYAKVPDSLKKSDLVDWIMTFGCNDAGSKKHSLEKWKQTHSVPWLLAAAMGVDKKSPEAAAIAAECAKQESGPGHWSFFYYANELSNNATKVRTDLDKVLSRPQADLSLGSLNQLKTQRLSYAQNLDEIVRFGLQNPEPETNNGGTEGVPDDVQDIVSKGKVKLEPPVLTGEAGNILCNKLPLSLLKQIAVNKQLPASIRNNIAWTSWVRAILIGDNNAARELAPIMKPLNKNKAAFIDAYMAATTPEAANFAAAVLILHFSSAQPNASFGPLSDDDYGDASGWWWGSTIFKPDTDPLSISEIDPPFLSAAQKAETKAQLAKLARVEPAPNYLGKIVLAYARAHPTDPRVPETLHWFVKCTKYGLTDDASKAMSKQAFQLLHSKYKGNTWTKQTPYYY